MLDAKFVTHTHTWRTASCIILDIITYIKPTFKNIFLIKICVNSSNFRDKLSFNTMNINNQTISEDVHWLDLAPTNRKSD